MSRATGAGRAAFHRGARLQNTRLSIPAIDSKLSVETGVTDDEPPQSWRAFSGDVLLSIDAPSRGDSGGARAAHSVRKQAGHSFRVVLSETRRGSSDGAARFRASRPGISAPGEMAGRSSRAFIPFEARPGDECEAHFLPRRARPNFFLAPAGEWSTRRASLRNVRPLSVSLFFHRLCLFEYGNFSLGRRLARSSSFVRVR